MHRIVENLLKINEKVKRKFESTSHLTNLPKIIAVSKTFKIDHIEPVINHGHLDYGENKVQEAVDKWTEVKKNNKDLKLHLIGRLQTNKVKPAVQLFDYIHSLDNKKLANKICKVQSELNKKIKLFIQVNIGDEDQKSGISKKDLPDFYNFCLQLGLDIKGLMCIPPLNEDPIKYFVEMNKLKKKMNLEELSMGMSSDYIEAVENGSTFLRIGSGIFGQRS